MFLCWPLARIYCVTMFVSSLMDRNIRTVCKPKSLDLPELRTNLLTMLFALNCKTFPIFVGFVLKQIVSGLSVTSRLFIDENFKWMNSILMKPLTNVQFEWYCLLFFIFFELFHRVGEKAKEHQLDPAFMTA